SRDDDEPAGIRDARTRRDPVPVRRLREEEADVLVRLRRQVAARPGGAPDDDVLRETALHVLVDVDREHALRQPSKLAVPHRDHATDERGVRVSEPLGGPAHCERGARRVRRAGEHERPEGGADEGGADQTSISRASPCPPPEQMAARPSPPPFRRSSWTIVATMRPPDAPIGCPSATAPPFTFTISSS